jgi:uncharacterized membrane protein
MKTILFLLVMAILGFGIWYYIRVNKPFGTTSEKITLTDTLIITKDSLIDATVFDSIPAGFYQGMLPCKNCEGIQRTIAFSKDHFKMEDLSHGKSLSVKKTEGTWEKHKDRFVLYQDDKAISMYKLVKDSLIIVENNGGRVPDSLSSQYVLFKKNTAPENPSWKKRKSEGIDIIGNGNEPFWSLEIDNEKLILFRSSASEKPVIVPIEKPVITKDSTIYSITTEIGDVLRVSIASAFCHDGMGDHLYEYKMTVRYKGQIYKGCAINMNPAIQD